MNEEYKFQGIDLLEKIFEFNYFFLKMIRLLLKNFSF